MTVFVRPIVGALAAAAFLSFAVAANAADKVRVALGDVVSVETLAFVVALERAKDRGVDYELTSFAKEELAIQAVVNGQADLGIGTPYSVIQKTKAPLKIVYQMSRLVFFPVASIKSQDLEGSRRPADHLPRPRHRHRSHRQHHRQARRASSSASAATCRVENRIIAMMNGQIKATVVDLANKNLLMTKAADRFHVLPGVDRPGERRDPVFASARLARRRTRTRQTSSSRNAQALARDDRSRRSSKRSGQAGPPEPISRRKCSTRWCRSTPKR